MSQMQRERHKYHSWTQGQLHTGKRVFVQYIEEPMNRNCDSNKC